MHSGAALYSGRFFHERYTQSAFIGLTFNGELAVHPFKANWLRDAPPV